MKKIYTISALLGSTLVLSNCALLGLPFQALGGILGAASTAVQTATNVAAGAATKAAPFFLEYSEDGSPIESDILEGDMNDVTPQNVNPYNTKPQVAPSFEDETVELENDSMLAEDSEVESTVIPVLVAY